MSDAPTQPRDASASREDLLVNELRAELEAQPERLAKAVIADGLGRRQLHAPGREAQAVRDLLAAYNHEPSFRPPLFALVEGFERRRSLKNLGRLYEAEAKSAIGPEERASALVDRALLALLAGDAAGADALVDEVVALAPSGGGTWAVVEAVARSRGRADVAARAIGARLESATHPELVSALAFERAIEIEQASPSEALALLVRAAEAVPGVPRIQSALDRVARAAGRGDLVVEAIEKQAHAATDATLRAGLFAEAAALLATAGDASRALELSAEAVSATPDDCFAWFVRLEVAETAVRADVDGGVDAFVEAVRRVVELGGPALGPTAAVLAAHAARVAESAGRGEDARRWVAIARELAADSATALAIVDRTEHGARSLGALRRGQLAGESAWLRALDAAARGSADEFALAAEQASVESPATRLDLALLALALGRDDVARTALAAMDAGELADEHRAIWRWVAIANAPVDAKPALARAALADEACGAWAPSVARVVAARAKDGGLLAQAHELLAASASRSDVVAAHQAARARAAMQMGDLATARTALDAALDARPSDSYARALLEELGRATGDVEAVLATLRAKAETPAELATELTKAALVAEATGNDSSAKKSAEEALQAAPEFAEAAHILLRVALRARDVAAARAARRLLSNDAAALASALDETDVVRRSEFLGALVERESVGLEAALAMAATPRTQHADVEAARRSARETFGIQLAEGADPLASVRASEPGGWLALADEIGESAVLVHALRVALARGELDDDVFFRVADLDLAPSATGPDAAAVVAETHLDAVLRGESADLTEFADAWAHHLEHVGDASSRAAHARVLVRLGRADESIETLKARLAEEPDDVASLDALRVAARDVRDWSELVRACDALASLVQGELRAQLLEEAAAVLMDEVDDAVEAERRCRDALAIDPLREIAYARLHDLLAERGDDAALLDLVNARSEAFDDPEQLAPLLYEQARLFRGLGQVDEALAALENLLLLEPEHVGGLALQVEIHVQREAFADAVEALRALASAESAPVSQRRIARLGAAEFLEKKLHDPAGALAELKAIDTELKLADRAVYDRMARLAEKVGRTEDAAHAHAQSAARSDDPERKAEALRRLAELARREGRLEDAANGYRQALEVWPEDVDAAEALADIPVAGDAEDRVKAVSRALRAGAFALDVEHVGKIERIARLAGDWPLTTAAQELLRAFSGVPSPGTFELTRLRTANEARLSVVVPPLARDAAFELALATCEVLVAWEPWEPSTFDATKADLRARGADPASDLIGALTTQLGVVGDVYIAGEGRSFAFGTLKERPFFVAGKNLKSASQLAFETAFAAAAIRSGLAPLGGRLARQGAAWTTTALQAALAAAGVAVAGAEARDGFADLAKAFGRAMPKTTRATIVGLGVAKLDGAAIAAFVKRYHGALLRTAALASGDLTRALAACTGATAKVDAVATSESASSLARDWLRPEVLAARGELGWRGAD